MVDMTMPEQGPVVMVWKAICPWLAPKLCMGISTLEGWHN